MQTFSVLNIFRTSEQKPSFIVALVGNGTEYYKVDDSLSERISKGMLFIGDRIRIREATTNGVVFDVINDDPEDLENIPTIEARPEIEFFYSHTDQKINYLIKPNIHFLPYLCDILPYSILDIDQEEAHAIKENQYIIGDQTVSNIKLPLSGMFIGKVVQKTRINKYPTSFNPFFFVIVSSGGAMVKVVFWIESLKEYSGLKVGDVILVKEYRKKKRWSIVDKIDANTFTESIYFDVEEVTAKQLVKIKVPRKGPPKFIFDIIEGKIGYLSVLMRFNCNDTLMEYVLMHIDGKRVVLFYNSDISFYKLQVGCYVTISELRRLARAGSEFYVSTIYTQFEIQEREIESENIQETAKRAKMGSMSKPEIFGAIGFLPDMFQSLTEITDYFHKELVNKEDEKSREISVNLFMKPTFISLEDLSKPELVLNESKKFLVHGVITQLADLECIVDYVEDGVNKKQGSFAIILDGKMTVFVYENFFNDRTKDNPSLMFKDSGHELVGKPHYLVIEAFRTGEDTILYYLTGIVPGPN